MKSITIYFFSFKERLPQKNFQGLIHSGLTNILGTPDGKVHRRLTRDSLIEIGDPFQPFIYGQVSFPVKMALQFNIGLIFGL